jgi:hypothetical protein
MLRNRYSAWTLVISVLILVTTITAFGSEGRRPAQPSVIVYTSEYLLPAGTNLTDGGITPIEITDLTFLAWVDLMPLADFAHPTLYILIQANGEVRVERGWWPPEIDGELFLYGWPPSYVGFPMTLLTTEDYLKVYAYPEALNSKDELLDGENPIILTDTTLLYWIDPDPYADFSHPSIYILVSSEGIVRVEHGDWWPTLNGEQILYAKPPTLLETPFDELIPEPPYGKGCPEEAD